MSTNFERHAQAPNQPDETPSLDNQEEIVVPDTPQGAIRLNPNMRDVNPHDTFTAEEISKASGIPEKHPGYNKFIAGAAILGVGSVAVATVVGGSALFKRFNETTESLEEVLNGRPAIASSQEYSPDSEFITPSAEIPWDSDGNLPERPPQISPEAFKLIYDPVEDTLDISDISHLPRQEKLSLGSALFDFYEESVANDLRNLSQQNLIPHLPGEKLPNLENFSNAHINNTGQEILNQITLRQFITDSWLAPELRDRAAPAIFDPETELLKHNELIYSDGSPNSVDGLVFNVMSAGAESDTYYEDTFLMLEPNGVPTKAIMAREHREGIDVVILAQFEETGPNTKPLWIVKAWLPISEAGAPSDSQELYDLYGPEMRSLK